MTRAKGTSHKGARRGRSYTAAVRRVFLTGRYVTLIGISNPPTRTNPPQLLQAHLAASCNYRDISKFNRSVSHQTSSFALRHGEMGTPIELGVVQGPLGTGLPSAAANAGHRQKCQELSSKASTHSLPSIVAQAGKSPAQVI